MKDLDKRLLKEYKAKPCSVCGAVDETLDFVLYGLKEGNAVVKICYSCDYRNWISTFGR